MKNTITRIYLLIVSVMLAIWLVIMPVMTSPAMAATRSAPILLAAKPEPSQFSKKQQAQVSPQWGLCGRRRGRTKRSSGFTGNTAGTYINDIQVILQSDRYSTVTLNWVNADASKETLPVIFESSPGAGNCNVDCRSIKNSKKKGSNCTPLSPPNYLIQGYNCALSSYPEAKFVSWFDLERGISFHTYTVPPYPASHGCVRLVTQNQGAEWIYDNTIPGVTQVNITWDPRSTSAGPKCWSNDRLVNRPTKKLKSS
jgi:L,D-transpeptidase catalytic domain